MLTMTPELERIMTKHLGPQAANRDLNLRIVTALYKRNARQSLREDLTLIGLLSAITGALVGLILLCWHYAAWIDGVL